MTTRSRTSFGDLTIEYDDSVLVPRPWTIAQAQWARRLLDDVPDGPVLELCAGVGHIGLAAVSGTGRSIVLVDRDSHAAGFARTNARPLGDRVSIRQAPMNEALGSGERFALVVADPPWVPTAEVARFPQDPRGAIDGGADGLLLARECLRVAGRHLLAGGQVLLQLGDLAQAEALTTDANEAGLLPVETRVHEGGVVVRLLDRSGHEGAGS